MMGVASKAIAGCFALAAFSVAVIAGLASDNTAATILTRALFAMVACYPVGLLVGFVCRRVIEQHLVEPPETQETGSVSEPARQSAESAEKAEDVIVV